MTAGVRFNSPNNKDSGTWEEFKDDKEIGIIVTNRPIRWKGFGF